MAGGNYGSNQGDPQQGGYPNQGYPQQGGYASPYQPYGNPNQPQGYPGGYIPPEGMPTEWFGGFWIRLLAYIIDSFVLAIPAMVVSAIVFMAFGYDPAIMFDTMGQMNAVQDTNYHVANNVSSLAQILIAWPYFALMHSMKGATLGKLALGLRAVDEYGMHMSFARATGRYFATLLSACLCLIGYLMAGFHPKKRGLHDLIAGTYVVRKECVNPAQHELDARQGY